MEADKKNVYKNLIQALLSAKGKGIDVDVFVYVVKKGRVRAEDIAEAFKVSKATAVRKLREIHSLLMPCGAVWIEKIPRSGVGRKRGALVVDREGALKCLRSVVEEAVADVKAALEWLESEAREGGALDKMGGEGESVGSVNTRDVAGAGSEQPV